MTIDEIKFSNKTWLNAADICGILESDPQYIRWAARNDPSKLGFPTVVLGKRVKINRKRFLQFLGEIP